MDDPKQRMSDSGQNDKGTPPRGSSKDPNRREMLRRLGGITVLTFSILKGNPLLAASSSIDSGDCGSLKPDGGVYSDMLCFIEKADNDCGLSVSGGESVHSDSDCSLSVPGSQTQRYEDGDCGLISDENGGRHEDLDCQFFMDEGLTRYQDNDCAIRKNSSLELYSDNRCGLKKRKNIPGLPDALKWDDLDCSNPTGTALPQRYMEDNNCGNPIQQNPEIFASDKDCALLGSIDELGVENRYVDNDCGKLLIESPAAYNSDSDCGVVVSGGDSDCGLQAPPPGGTFEDNDPT